MNLPIWVYVVLVAILCFAGFLCVIRWRSSRRRALEGRKARQLLVEVYSTMESLPELTILTSYGWPAYLVRFLSKDEFNVAKNNGMNERFSKGIYGIHHPLLPAFDSSLSVSFVYQGWEQDLKRQFAEQAAEDREYTEKWNRENPHHQYPVRKVRDDA